MPLKSMKKNSEKSGMKRAINNILILFMVLLPAAACRKNTTVRENGIPVAQVGNDILYYDEIPAIPGHDTNKTDSAAYIQSYINRWAKREFVLQKAAESLTPELKQDIDRQVEETRANLLIYQYQKQMMLEKMDTIITDQDLETYYSDNQSSFALTINIVKALFIQIPSSAKDLSQIRSLARSNNPQDLQTLRSLCNQYSGKYDDFGDQWVPLSRITVQLQEDIQNEDIFLKKNTFWEGNDSRSNYFVSIRDYRMRASVAPYDYVKGDIRRIIWNSRRIDFIQNTENSIYTEALKANKLKTY